VSATAMIETRTASAASTAGARVGALAGLGFAFLFFMGTAMLDLPHGLSDSKMLGITSPCSTVAESAGSSDVSSAGIGTWSVPPEAGPEEGISVQTASAGGGVSRKITPPPYAPPCSVVP